MKHLPLPPPSPAMAELVMGIGTKVAITDFATVIITLQVPVPEHAPDQPENLYPLLAWAVKITDTPELKLAEQADLQIIPEGLIVTVPLADVTDRAY
jgi:hypothetical protein